MSESIKVPVRIVLNPYTFSVFTNADYTNIKTTIPLNNIKIKAVNNFPTCFEVVDDR